MRTVTSKLAVQEYLDLIQTVRYSLKLHSNEEKQNGGVILRKNLIRINWATQVRYLRSYDQPATLTYSIKGLRLSRILLITVVIPFNIFVVVCDDDDDDDNDNDDDDHNDECR